VYEQWPGVHVLEVLVVCSISVMVMVVVDTEMGASDSVVIWTTLIAYCWAANNARTEPAMTMMLPNCKTKSKTRRSQLKVIADSLCCGFGKFCGEWKDEKKIPAA
jgi:hypothetical protein